MSTRFDSTVPERLKKGQQWFAGIITQPIDEDSCIPKMAPSGRLIQEEAWVYIKPSPTLLPARRIELYAQQYWWRLLSVLHDSYPLVTRLFGYEDFNRTIGMPYLQKYAPNHWSLNLLGGRLPLWIEEEYHGADKPLICEAALLDHAYHASFFAKELKPLKLADFPEESDFSRLLTVNFHLQPYLHFLKFERNLPAFRMELLDESPEYWIDHDFPKLEPADGYFVIFRNGYGQTVWDQISLAEVTMLNYFKYGSTIEEACQRIELESAEICAAAEQKLHVWVQSWIIKQWIGLPEDEK